VISYVIKCVAADNALLCIRSLNWLSFVTALAEAAKDLPDNCAVVELAYPDGGVFWSGTREEVLRFGDARRR
jgi:hypothetical protein